MFVRLSVRSFVRLSVCLSVTKLENLKTHVSPDSCMNFSTSTLQQGTSAPPVKDYSRFHELVLF